LALDSELKTKIKKYAALNAYQYEGVAQVGPVLGRVLAEHPELRSRAKEILPAVEEAVKEVNSWTRAKQESYLEKHHPELLEVKKEREAAKKLPPLKNVDKWPMVKTRFAPNPDGALHLGSAEPIIFCDEYAKMYDGHFVLRYEDTSIEVKPPIPEMYDAILEDLKWLGVEVHEIYIQSDRLEIYYEYAEKLISMGKAYICDCDVETFRSLYRAGKPCPCRGLDPEEHLRRWNQMLDGTYRQGEAVVRVKTDLNHPNPAVRDWPALRISETPHPRKGTKYRVWPLYNFSCGLDDHLMEISHVIRGKEHDVNTVRQRWLHKHFGWKSPEVINVGRLGLEVGVLSKSKMREGIEKGIYNGWDDPRLGTLRALRRRGIQPQAIRNLMIHVGPKPVNVSISWDFFAAENRRIIEPLSNRYSFVSEPVKLVIKDIEGPLKSHLPLHPDYPDRGIRSYKLKPVKGQLEVYVSRKDLERFHEGEMVRLMGLVNVEVESPMEGLAVFHSHEMEAARKGGAAFINWVPPEHCIPGKVVMPDASEKTGLVEEAAAKLRVNDVFQFERFGYCRLDALNPFTAYFAHT